MTHPGTESEFVDPELGGTNAAIARDMREAAEATQLDSALPLDQGGPADGDAGPSRGDAGSLPADEDGAGQG